ncbi:MAG: 4Fe-4S dicluster domain-containing protein, partial [Bacillota bacterium]
MNIIDERCTGCAGCLKYCPMKAISIVERKARIDHDRCAECDLCYRIGVCPSKAFAPDQDLPWPRSIRSILSNPLTEFKETGVTGRGTEEMKTNEVTDRFKEGFLGICIDVGRPNVGARLRDVEVITRAVAPLGVAFEEKNPVTYLMVDKKTGRLNPEVLNEAVVSAVVEFVIPEALLANILASLRDCASKV